MHQPQYREPGTGRYLLPWTRLHALKDYWGMVRVLGEFPGVHATYNFVPSLGAQIEEYASGKFNEPWFELAFASSEALKTEQKREILGRAFQVNEQILGRWPRFQELHSQVRLAGAETCIAQWTPQDWRDLQTLSQIAWMDEEYLAKDPVVCALSLKGRGYTEDDKAALRDKQIELLGGPAGIPPGGRARADRDFNNAFLSSNPASCVRHGYRPRGEFEFASAASAVSLSAGRPGTARSCAAVSRTRFRQASGWAVAFGRIGFGPIAGNRDGAGVRVVRHG
jgi:hypothetical protein